MAGDQLSNPLVDFSAAEFRLLNGWGSTLKPPGRLLVQVAAVSEELGINSQTPW